MKTIIYPDAHNTDNFIFDSERLDEHHNKVVFLNVHLAPCCLSDSFSSLSFVYF
jgi:hypothetical protein